MNTIVLPKLFSPWCQLFFQRAPLLPHTSYTPPSNLVPPPIFDFQLEHIFVLNRIMFAQALAYVPHLSSSGISRMVYEHLSRCFIPNHPSSMFLKLFQVVIVITHGDIFKLVTLVLGTSRLLAMAKDTSGFCLIIVRKVFFQLINCSIILQLQGPF